MWTFKTYGINFLFLFLGSCVIRKPLHSSWWELEKNLCGLRVGWAEIIRQTVSFLLVCVCVFVGWRVGWVWHNQVSNIDLLRSFPLLWNIPCPFLDIFFFFFFLTKRPLHLVVNKAVTIVPNRILSLHIVWFSLTNICVVTKQMRDKTIRKVNKWPVTKATLRFSL